MSKTLAIYTTPDDSAVELRHDNGLVFHGVSGAGAGGRPGFLMMIDGVPDGHGAELVVSRDNYVTVHQRGTLWLSRPGDYAEFVVDDVRLSPFSRRVLPALVTRGQFFAQIDGTPFTAIEASDFNLLAVFASDPAAARQVVRQRVVLGFNLLRVWTLMHLSQFGIGDLDPCPYEAIPDFVAMCAHEGCYVEFTAYTSTKYPEHWAHFIDACHRCKGTVPLLELVNENDQSANTINTDVPRPSGLLCSHGSNGSQAYPVDPFWDYATFHTNDAPEEQRKIGHNAWEIWNGATLTNETSRCPDVGMWRTDLAHAKQLAYDSAAGAALLCAGSCFHSVAGKRSTLWDGFELECAREWAAGAKSVPLEFQAGRYNRIDDPAVLRTYQRILPDGRAHTVQIRY